MRIKMLLSLLAMAAILTTHAGTGLESAHAADSQPANAVVVYYFHGNFRCTNCYNMEQWTKELMGSYFKDRVDAGTIVFRMFNTDEKENRHYLNDYKLYTKSVVLSLVKGGKEVRYDNLAKVWDCLRSKQKFQEYVRTEIEKYLKEL